MNTVIFRLGLATLLAIAAMNAAATELRTAAQEDSEPKFVSQGGKVSGLCVDIMRAIEKTDPTLKFSGDQVWVPLKRIEFMVQNKQLDVACGFIRNKEREANYQIVTPRLFPVQYKLVARANDTVSVQNWADVRKLGQAGVVLVNSGSGPVKRLEELGGLMIDSGARTSASNLQKLASGRGRFFYYRIPGLTRELMRSGLMDQFKVLPAVLEADDFYLMAGNHVAKDTVERLSAAVKSLEAKGELARLVAKWDAY
jgi:ABC-type amino acid transport substrate-binding protein